MVYLITLPMLCPTFHWYLIHILPYQWNQNKLNATPSTVSFMTEYQMHSLQNRLKEMENGASIGGLVKTYMVQF